MNIITPSFRCKILEGKNKVLFKNEKKGQIELYFKDLGDKTNQDIGIYKKLISDNLFILLSECGIYNHFLSSIGMREQKILALDMLPITFSVYAFITEEMSKRFFLPNGMKLKDYLVETHINNQFENIVSKEHLINFGWLKSEDVDYLIAQSLRIMDIIYSFFKGLNITVLSIHLRFGKRYINDGEDYDCILGDELSLKNINLKFNDLLTCEINEAYLKLADKMTSLRI